ncbi:hypothetical protein [Enterococcus casseliflavus]|uniref:hypothetical protein n=1 Tax=Enterococcus casseliflavus TaxID=37734 RepID=UPI003D0CEDCE
MKDYFFFELRQLLKSKKTIGLFCLLLIYSGVYSFWQRDFRPIERVDKTEMQQRYTVRQDFLDQQAANPSDHMDKFYSGAFALGSGTSWGVYASWLLTLVWIFLCLGIMLVADKQNRLLKGGKG